MDSSEMLKTIKTQLDIIDKLSDIKKEMELIVITGDMEGTYRNALFTGVIKFVNPKITYTKMRFGMSKETVLSDPNSKPYGQLVPLYQRFVSFAELDEGMLYSINKEVETKLTDTSKYFDELKSSCDSLEAILNESNMGEMRIHARKFPEKTDEIVYFYMNMRKEIENFRLLYGII